jgi:hypothetical protein
MQTVFAGGEEALRWHRVVKRKERRREEGRREE